MQKNCRDLKWVIHHILNLTSRKQSYTWLVTQLETWGGLGQSLHKPTNARLVLGGSKDTRPFFLTGLKAWAVDSTLEQWAGGMEYLYGQPNQREFLNDVHHTPSRVFTDLYFFFGRSKLRKSSDLMLASKLATWTAMNTYFSLILLIWAATLTSWTGWLLLQTKHLLVSACFWPKFVKCFASIVFKLRCYEMRYVSNDETDHFCKASRSLKFQKCIIKTRNSCIPHNRFPRMKVMDSVDVRWSGVPGASTVTALKWVPRPLGYWVRE